MMGESQIRLPLIKWQEFAAAAVAAIRIRCERKQREFTQAPVQLTPPSARSGPLDTVDELDEMQNNFVQFSFHSATLSSLRDASEGMDAFD
ncbi:unnamed protein product [Gongylonema pulchrum]|uniref:Protein kinase C-terminal domain-containing protein n=1 Tax=Gongylonema pulchrum TaxID=637853 RepID=A0A183E1G3_9BILA|nr:unnamed protein product [Gongylonema pulchrum]